MKNPGGCCITIGIAVLCLLGMRNCAQSGSNEAEKKIQILENLEQSCVSVSSSLPADPQNDGKVVYVSGLITTDERLHDEEFELKGIHAVKFGRTVEMYQWEEYDSGTESSPTKEYRKVWSPVAINSNEFENSLDHFNPPFKISDKHLNVEHIMIGKLPISGELLSMAPVVSYEFVTRYQNPRAAERIFLKGEEPENPEIGDHRVSFYILRSDVEVSVIARQENGMLSGKSLSTECDLMPSITHAMCQKDMWKDLQAKYKKQVKLFKGLDWFLGCIIENPITIVIVLFLLLPVIAAITKD